MSKSFNQLQLITIFSIRIFIKLAPLNLHQLDYRLA